MKKRVLYVSTLILYLLIACTIVSQKIEVEMHTQVEASIRRYTGYVGNPFSISLDALFEDEEGMHLYELVEGTGWQSGQCAQEIPTSVWQMNYRTVSIPNAGRNYILVESASRLLRDGEEVEIVEVPGRGRDYVPFTDQYLVCYPEGVPEDFILPEASEIVAKSDTALLLDMGDIILPFFEQRAKQLSDSMEYENCRVFSMTEVEDFLEQLPRAAVLGVYLLLPILIWMCSGLMIREPSRYKELLLINVGITLFFFLCAIGMLGQIDFPASLMPIDNIFDISHYVQEFELIVKAQSTLNITEKAVAVRLTEVKNVIACILSVGMFAGVVLSAAEFFVVKKTAKSWSGAIN